MGSASPADLERALIVKISHHRGGSEGDDSDTLSAYEAAAARQAELVEFDVWRSSDGVFYCTHEELAPNGKKLTDLTWAAIQDAMGPIPRYVDLLELFDGASICHIDIKEKGYEIELVSLAESVLKDPSTSVILTTLEDSSVRLIRRRFPQYVVALSLGRDVRGETKLRALRTRLSEFVPLVRLVRSRSNAVAANYRLITRPLLWFCRLTGRQVLVWTVNDDALLERYLGMDAIDVIVTDRPIRATEIRKGIECRAS